MKKRKIILGLMLLATIQTGLISCSKANNEVKESKFYSLTIDGDKKYISEDSEESKEIEEFAKKFIEYGVKSNYKNKNYLKEVDLYDESVKESFMEIDYLNELDEYVQGNEIIINVNDSEVKKAEFHNVEGKDSVKVYIDYNYTYEHATEEFLADRVVEIGKTRSRSVFLDLIKENGEWKISSSGIIEDENSENAE